VTDLFAGQTVGRTGLLENRLKFGRAARLLLLVNPLSTKQTDLALIVVLVPVVESKSIYLD
jgi:hypothetical protein